MENLGQVLSILLHVEGRYEPEPHLIALGDTYEGEVVKSIEVHYPSDRMPTVILGHGEICTVIPDARIVRYVAGSSKP